MTAKNIIFEQPLNEQIRLCLRLEHLFEQANHYLSGRSTWDTRQVLNTILEILLISDRPDLKNKLGQALTQYSTYLAKLEKQPGVDKRKLSNMRKQIEQSIHDIRSNTQKAGQEVRENEFLMALQQRLYTPAGTCNFSMPAYHLWLEQDKKIIQQQLLCWLAVFEQLQLTIDLMLKIIRESGSFKATNATGGFYQSNLDPNIHYQMIRIRIATEKNLFPEISVGRHRLAIHFFTVNLNGRAAQTPDDVAFELACCKV